MRKEHNKLIRDNIPSIIQQANKTCKTRILNNEEYIHYLKLKLIEESNEVYHSDNDHIKEEIADVLEVIDALMSTFNIQKDDIDNIRNIKAMKNGRFDNKIFLEYVEDNDE